MNAATIELTGIGHVEINTGATEVMFCGGTTTGGDPVNCVAKRVSRSAKNAKAAILNREYTLAELKPGYFRLV